MRKAVFIIAGLQFAIAILFMIQAFTLQSDAAGEGMARGFALVGFIAVSLFNGPALLLAAIDRYLKVALVLSLACPVLFFVSGANQVV